MSTATQLTEDQAYDLLMEQVYVPTFFNKLAAHGVLVDNDEDAIVALRTAAKLRNAEQQAAVTKTASASRFAGLEAKVDEKLQKAGMADNREFDFAVTKLASDATIANAVIQLQNAAAQRVLAAQPKA